ncbi:lanthionine synthetase C family protein [Bifidobacterium catenulatum]|uniref:lanthionine synthetase C family protein n=1 Tax=Bifidobacterium catenulatum TaxID=1686 RepID=UPI003D2EB75C
MLSSKADFTLMKGWLGAGLFLWKASLCRKDDALRSRAESIFRLTLTHLVNVDNKERPIYYVDYLKNKPRTMPYLDCGTSGVALAFIEVYKDGNDSMEFLNEEFLKRLSLGSDMVCTFNGGLFGGYAGLLPAAIALRDLGIDDGLWKRIIDGLNLYLMKNNGSIVFPGLYGYKCSMDLGTGSAGVLLALSDSERSGEWGSWMPVLKNGDFSLFCV